MPVVPSYENNQVTPGAPRMVPFTATEQPDIAGKQMREMGAALTHSSNVLGNLAQQMQAEATATAAKEVDTQVTASTTEALFNPESGYLSTSGKNAVEGYEAAKQKLAKIRQSALDNTRAPAVQRVVNPIIDARINSAMENLNRHFAQESQRYKVQTSDSRALVSLQAAAENFTDDKGFQVALNLADGEASNIAGMLGWGDDKKTLAAQEYRSKGWQLRYENWRAKDPLGAFQHFQANAASIAPDERQRLGSELFQAAAPAIAEQINASGGFGITQDPSAPRGMRNNNPGNIVKAEERWQGETLGSDPKYATFSSPEAGIRAIGRTLLTYQSQYGLNTVEGIISRWAPASENDTAGYIRTVSSAIGVAPDEPIDVQNRKTMLALTKAIIQVENGQQPYADKVIARGVDAARGNTPPLPVAETPTRDLTTPTGMALVDSLPANWRLHVMQMARSQAQQSMSENREALRQRVDDASAAYLTTGMAPNPPGEADFVGAYGQVDGVRRYREFQDVAALGGTLQQVKTLPNVDLEALLTQAKPEAGAGEGYAAKLKNYEVLTRAVDQVMRARSDDPMAYAIEAGGFNLNPIRSIDDSQGFIGELSRRAGVAMKVSESYGTPLKLLTNGEAKALAANLRVMPVEQQKTQLAAIYRGTGHLDTYQAVMREISPDTPTLAVAGMYQARGLHSTQGRDVADLILRGQAILTPYKKEDGNNGHLGGQALVKMPEEKLILSEWMNITGDAFRGREQAADLFLQTAKTIYAARSAEDGDYSGIMNSKRWKAAVALATGGIAEHNGNSIVMPYGMGYDRFQDILKAQSEHLEKTGRLVNTTAAEMTRLPLQNIGDGRYLFQRGSGYLVDKDGRPVEVDLRERSK